MRHFFLALLLCASNIAGAQLLRKHKPENVVGIKAWTLADNTTTLGSQIKVDVQTIETNGKKTYMVNDVPWSEFKVEVKGGEFRNGRITATKKLAETEGGKLVVKFTYIPKPGFDTTITIDLVTGKKLLLYFKGESGESGPSGQSGDKGESSGKSCREGTPGQDGGDGQDGADGPEIEVYLKKKMIASVGKELICIMVVNLHRSDTSFMYMDPAGSLRIYASGGAGGYGGNGGQGGYGGIASETGYKCKGGPGGNGGNGGNGGDGGKITVYVDPGIDLANYDIKFVNLGGSGGSGGAGAEGGGHGATTIPTKENRATDGQKGRDGYDGRPGPKPLIKTEPLNDELFSRF